MLNLTGRMRPEFFFIVAALLFEALLIIIVPPLQSPDELNHFYRSYQISEGHFLPVKTDKRLGGPLPYSFVKFSEPFMKAAGNEYHRVSHAEVMAAFDLEIDAGETEFQDFPNTAYYSPISYAPQAVALFVLRNLDASVGVLYYGGRLFVFAVWLLCMYHVIRVVPVHKWLFTVLILLPMNVYITNSFSADIVTNILSFLLLAMIFKLMFGETISRRDVWALVLLAVLLALAKVIYVVLALLVLAIPAAKFRSVRHRWTVISLILSAGFLVAYLWSGMIMKYYISYSTYNPAYKDLAAVSKGADYYLQKEYVLSHGTYFLKVIYNTLVTDPQFYLLSYIGGYGTYLHLFISTTLAVLSFALIIFIALTERSAFSFSPYQKLVFFVVGSGMFVLLLLSQHLTWNIVGNTSIDFIQGRYLTPFFVLFFLLFSNLLTRIKINTVVVAVVFVLFVNGYACYFLYTAFVKDLSYHTLEFYCDTEQVDKWGSFKTSNPKIWLEGGIAQTDKEHRSGKYSTVLSPQIPYGCTYHFKNLDPRDLVEIEAWQKGEGGMLVVSGKGKSCSDFFFPANTPAYREKDGWSKLHMVFSMWQRCDSSEVGFYLFNPGKTTVYFDDITFKIKKYKDEARNLMAQ